MEIKKDADGNDIVPTVEEYQAELQKVETEKENYKRGLLEREAKLKELKGAAATVEIPEDDTDWDEASKKFQEETITKTQQAAAEIVNKTISEKNEKNAVAKWRANNPEITNEQWEKILANYNPINGKDSEESVIKDLDRADVLRRFDAGESIDPVQIQRRQANEVLLKSNINSGSGVSGAYEPKKDTTTPEQLSMAARMRVSEDSLKKEDDSFSAEIKLT